MENEVKKSSDQLHNEPYQTQAKPSLNSWTNLGEIASNCRMAKHTIKM